MGCSTVDKNFLNYLNKETKYAILDSIKEDWVKDQDNHVRLFLSIAQARSWLSNNLFDSTRYPDKYRIVIYTVEKQ